MPAVNDTVWAGAGHDAGRDRGGAARAAARAPRRERRLRAGARAQPRLHRRSPVERRDRQPPARASGATTPRARSSARSATGARRSTRVASVAGGRDADRRRARAHARDGDPRPRPRAPRAPRDDRRPARDHRPDDARLGAARALGGGRGAARACRSAVLLDSVEDPDVAGALRRAAGAARATATSSTSPGCARRRGASASRRSSTRRRSARACGEITRAADPQRARVRRRGAAAVRLADARGWAGRRGTLDARRARVARSATMGEVDGRARVGRLRTCPASTGVTLEFRDGGELSLDRGPGGLRGDQPRRRGRRAHAGRCSAPRAARAGSSARGMRQSLLRDPTYGEALDVGGGDADVSDPSVIRAADRRASPSARRALLADAARRRARRARRRTPRARRRHDAGGRLRAAAPSRWEGVELWFGDERCVGPEDPQSNYRMAARDAARARRRRARAPDRGRARRRGGGRAPTTRCCASGARRRRRAGARHRAARHRRGRPHRVAVPGQPRARVRATRRRSPVHDAPKPPPDRVSLTLRCCARRARASCSPSGAGKAAPLARVLAGPDAAVPASLLARERLTVIADTRRRWADGTAEVGPPSSSIVRHADTDWTVSGQHTGRTRHPAQRRRARKARGARGAAARGGAVRRGLEQPAVARARDGAARRLREPQLSAPSWWSGTTADYDGLTSAQITRTPARLGPLARRLPGRRGRAPAVGARADAAARALPADGDGPGVLPRPHAARADRALARPARRATARSSCSPRAASACSATSTAGACSALGPGGVIEIDDALSGDAGPTLAQDAREGLARAHKELSPKHLYDSHGAALFDEICELRGVLPDPHRAADPRAPRRGHRRRDRRRRARRAGLGERDEDAAAARRDGGRGDAAALRPGRRHRARRARERGGAERREYPGLRVHGLIGDFVRHLDRLPPPTGPRLLAFIGGTIGNFSPGERRALLRTIARAARPGGAPAAGHRPGQGPSGARGRL